MRTEDFRYPLPDSAIAQAPVEPRDSARLLDTRDLTDHRFRDLPELLRPGDLLVINTSRVRTGRLRGKKVPTGGAVEMLLLSDLGEGRWSAMVKPARRLRPGVVVDFGPLSAEVTEGPQNGEVIALLTAESGTVEEAIASSGQLPLPPYIRTEPPDPERYQTVYSERVGSAAAPTAGLHFTEGLLQALERRGISVARLELEVGLDTFRPITSDTVEEHSLGSERFHIPTETAAAVSETRRSGGRVVAVGTTVVRALETRANKRREIDPGYGSTELFIKPGYEFLVTDSLVTNFHLPASTLLVLVAAFMGARWRAAYEHGLAHGYRFLSWGDAMYAQR